MVEAKQRERAERLAILDEQVTAFMRKWHPFDPDFAADFTNLVGRIYETAAEANAATVAELIAERPSRFGFR
jgi:hypothetical protein